MMIIKREKLIKKVVGIMIFIMAMITIITNVNSKKIYAYEISPEVNGTVDVQYTLNYVFEEHYKPGEVGRVTERQLKQLHFLCQ